MVSPDSSTSTDDSMDENEKRFYSKSAASLVKPRVASQSHSGSTVKISTPPSNIQNKNNNNTSTPSKASSSIKRSREAELTKPSSKKNKATKMEENEKKSSGEKKGKRKAVAEVEKSPKKSGQVWNPKDEIAFLKGLEACSQRGKGLPKNMALVYDHVRSLLDSQFSNEQLYNKLKRFRSKFHDVKEKVKGEGFGFKSPHEETVYKLSKQVWGKVEEEEEEKKTAARAIEEEEKKTSARPIEEKEEEEEEEVQKRKPVVEDEEEEEKRKSEDVEMRQKKGEETEDDSEEEEEEAQGSLKGMPKLSNTNAEDVKMTQKEEEEEEEDEEEEEEEEEEKDERKFMRNSSYVEQKMLNKRSEDVEMTQNEEDEEDEEEEEMDERKFMGNLNYAEQTMLNKRSENVEMTQNEEDDEEDESESYAEGNLVQHIADGVSKQSNAKEMLLGVSNGVVSGSGRGEAAAEESEEEEEEEDDGSESDTKENKALHISVGIPSNGMRGNGNTSVAVMEEEEKDDNDDESDSDTKETRVLHGAIGAQKQEKGLVMHVSNSVPKQSKDVVHHISHDMQKQSKDLVPDVSKGNPNNGSRRIVDIDYNKLGNKWINKMRKKNMIMINDFKKQLRKDIREGLKDHITKIVRAAMQSSSNNRTYDNIQFSSNRTIERISSAKGMPVLNNSEADDLALQWREQEIVEVEANIKHLALLQEEFQMRMAKLPPL